jgi:hypothetical protein
MSKSLDNAYFDFCLRVLNYALEFAKTPGYASTRFLDVLIQLVMLSHQIDNVSRQNFYEDLQKKLEKRPLMTSVDEQTRYLDDLLQCFLNEWKRTSVHVTN